MDNSEARREELLALRSIFEENDLFVEEDSNPVSGRLLATVHLPHSFFVLRSKKAHRKVKNLNNSDSAYAAAIKVDVEYLPPINLLFELPDTYPSQTPPAYLLSCNWLSLRQISLLCRKLESLWKEGDGEVVLFRWIQFLQEEVLTFLEIQGHLDVTKLSMYKRWKNIPSAPIKRNNCSTKCGTSYLQAHAGNLNFITVDSVKTHSDELGNMQSTNLDSVKSVCNTCASFEQSCLENCVSGEDKAEKLCAPQSVSGKVESKRTQALRPCVSGGSGPIDLRAVLDLTDGQMLLSLLEEFDKAKKHDAFKRQFFMCKVCFSEKPGSSFMQFRNCNHLYCRDCLRSYFEIQIRDGNVHSLNCPEDKCSSQADAVEIKELVGAQLFVKYDELLLSRTLDSMSDVAYCPRKQCQCPLLTDSSTNMGTCPACSFVFCVFCKMAYHGIAACNFKSSEKREICNKYINSKGEERALMEQRYGRKVLKFLVDNTLSEDWVELNSKKCPHCSACIEKTDGCNKMTCYSCSTYFCWLCMCRLKSSNPYGHFSDPGSPCYNQLFTGVIDDMLEMEDDVEFLPGEFL